MHAIYKHQLKNGMTVITCPFAYSAKVCTQLWYHVGSANEIDGQRGIAHLLEHMVFKGTNRLSEVDLTAIVHKLSGYTNAFTSYDYTGYIFSLPVRQWEVGLDILADCMSSCRLDQEHLNSEMRAVIQELRLYEDEFESASVERLLTQLFSGHPYQHPIIGYKADLRKITPSILRSFYRKWYCPNNSTLIVVGPVDHKAVVQSAEQFFGFMQSQAIERPPCLGWRPLVGKSAYTMYREVSQATAVICWMLPGLRQMRDTVAQALAYTVGSGKQSLLYQELIVKQRLAALVDANVQAMSDYTILSITIIADDYIMLQRAVDHTLGAVQSHQLDIATLERSIRCATVAWYNQMESAEEVAYEIGQQMLASGIINFVAPNDQVELIDHVIACHKELRATRASIAWVLPIAEKNKQLLFQVQAAASKDDELFLAKHSRRTAIESPVYVHQLEAIMPPLLCEPRVDSHMVINGLRCFYITRHNLQKIEYVVWLPANYLYDPLKLSGLASVTEQLLDQGTAGYPGQAFTAELEHYGMQLTILAGQIRLVALPENAKLALKLLGSMLTEATLGQESLERVKSEQVALIAQEEDNAYAHLDQVAREVLFSGHPCAHSPLGTIAGVEALGQKDVSEYYHSFMSPQGALLAVVVDSGIERSRLMEATSTYLGQWSGPSVPHLPSLPVDARKAQAIHIKRQRDQTAVALVARSVSVFDKNYYALALLDHILLGGQVGSMFSRLFQLREQTGLFYTIGGSLLMSAGYQPGYMIIKTLVNPESAAQVIPLLHTTLRGMKEISKEDLEQAQQALIVGLSDQFETAYGVARYYLRVQRYFQTDEWSKWYTQMIQRVTRKQLASVARDMLAPDRFTQITIGRD